MRHCFIRLFYLTFFLIDQGLLKLPISGIEIQIDLNAETPPDELEQPIASVCDNLPTSSLLASRENHPQFEDHEEPCTASSTGDSIPISLFPTLANKRKCGGKQVEARKEKFLRKEG
ncbi:hypothetical protein PCASD_07763, partial [Puccinia coronata f. sp. avenae]